MSRINQNHQVRPGHRTGWTGSVWWPLVENHSPLPSARSGAAEVRRRLRGHGPAGVHVTSTQTWRQPLAPSPVEVLRR